MIRVGRTRNLLRASSSLSETWPRSARHHLGQWHLSGSTNRPDKSPHSITCLRFRNSLQMRATSTREGWMSGPLPLPTTQNTGINHLSCRFRPGFPGLSTLCHVRETVCGRGAVRCRDRVSGSRIMRFGFGGKFPARCPAAAMPSSRVHQSGPAEGRNLVRGCCRR